MSRRIELKIISMKARDGYKNRRILAGRLLLSFS